MTMNEMLMAAIEANGYKPQVDDDGDVFVRYQLKTIYFFVDKREETFLSANLIRFADIAEGEDTLTLVACNRITRDSMFVKMYVDESLKSVSASCEFFFTDTDSLAVYVKYSMEMLSLARNTYRKVMDMIRE